jgi:hypothetical protein
MVFDILEVLRSHWSVSSLLWKSTVAVPRCNIFRGHDSRQADEEVQSQNRGE